MQQQVKTFTLRGSRSWVEEVILSVPSEHSVQEAATEDWQTVDGDAGKHRETFMLWNSASERNLLVPASKEEWQFWAAVGPTLNILLTKTFFFFGLAIMQLFPKLRHGIKSQSSWRPFAYINHSQCSVIMG